MCWLLFIRACHHNKHQMVAVKETGTVRKEHETETKCGRRDGKHLTLCFATQLRVGFRPSVRASPPRRATYDLLLEDGLHGKDLGRSLVHDLASATLLRTPSVYTLVSCITDPSLGCLD